MGAARLEAHRSGRAGVHGKGRDWGNSRPALEVHAGSDGRMPRVPTLMHGAELKAQFLERLTFFFSAHSYPQPIHSLVGVFGGERRKLPWQAERLAPSSASQLHISSSIWRPIRSLADMLRPVTFSKFSTHKSDKVRLAIEASGASLLPSSRPPGDGRPSGPVWNRIAAILDTSTPHERAGYGPLGGTPLQQSAGRWRRAFLPGHGIARHDGR